MSRVITQKSHSNQQFYAKRLNNQSFLSPTFKHEFSQVSQKIQHQIQVVKKNLRFKNLKMFRAKQKKRTIQRQHNLMMDTLRSKLETKMKASENNLEKIMLKKSTNSKSKQQMRATTLFKIKSNQKSLMQQSFRKSRRLSEDSEKYLLDRKFQKSMSKRTSLNFNPQQSRYNEEQTSIQNKITTKQSHRRILPRVLVTTDQQLKQKQIKKDRISDQKEVKNLHEYIQKLNYIDQKRQTRSIKLAQTMKLLQKQRTNQHIRYQSRRKQELEESEKSKYYSTSAAKTAIKDKYSFSEIYSKKLQEKINKRAFFQEEAIRTGNQLIDRQFRAKKSRNEKRLLNETIKQVQSKMNFKFLQKYSK